MPLSLVTRLEEVDVRKIEMSNGRHLVQYRGQLMPLIRVNDDVRIKSDGTQPLLVFSDGGRSMALVVDEIVDIVEESARHPGRQRSPGVLGSAVIKGQATEILDVGHFLPLAFADWFRRKETTADATTRRLLFVDDSAFFRNMLTPVLQGGRLRGHRRRRRRGSARRWSKGGERFDIVVTDIEMPDMDGFALARGGARR